ncbi:MAG TPA: hypothetical protein VKW08_13435 [Xanthobacteraceae bacterium]|jgi:hypothetical protein|nr:hypothetical protein [Xanthobacteraceae bacterium]
MPSATDLRRQAARCLRVAAAVENPSVAATLVAMAADISDKADEVDPSLQELGCPAKRGTRARDANP